LPYRRHDRVRQAAVIVEVGIKHDSERLHLSCTRVTSLSDLIGLADSGSGPPSTQSPLVLAAAFLHKIDIFVTIARQSHPGWQARTLGSNISS